MIVILSPSKTLDFDTANIKADCTQPDFLSDSRKLVTVLKKQTKSQIKKLMSVSDKIAELNYERYKSFKTPFSKKNAKPALFAFKGDVYQDIEVDDYSSSELKFAQKHIRILSGLYGVLKPLDLIQAYRLEMKTKLKNERGKDLYEFWGSNITKSINKALSTAGSSAPLVNLASNEYYSVIQPKDVKARIVTPVFKEKKGSDYKVVALYAKRARGMMANYIVREKLKKVDDLKNFNVAKYKFNKKLSSTDQFVFTR